MRCTQQQAPPPTALYGCLSFLIALPHVTAEKWQTSQVELVGESFRQNIQISILPSNTSEILVRAPYFRPVGTVPLETVPASRPSRERA